MNSLAPARSALAGLRLRRIPFAASQSAQVVSKFPFVYLVFRGFNPCPSAYSGVAATRLYAVFIRG